MNACEFYENFKEALDYLGLRWGNMALATVSIDGNKFTLSYGDKSATVTVQQVQSND